MRRTGRSKNGFVESVSTEPLDFARNGERVERLDEVSTERFVRPLAGVVSQQLHRMVGRPWLGAAIEKWKLQELWGVPYSVPYSSQRRRS